jgi:DNA-binding CsgD family transcriptional regulator
MSEIDISKNIGVISCNEIADICKPLYEILDLTYFNYVKLNADGSRSTLTDRPDFIVEYYKRKELYETKAVINMETSQASTCRLSSEFRDQPSYIAARNDFDIDNGITIIQPNGKETELFYFGTTRENYSKTAIYINNIDIFYRFIAYFKDKAQKLIKQADIERFYVPGIQIGAKPNVNDLASDIRTKFLDATVTDRFFLDNSNEDLFLTKREAECLFYLLHQKSAKEMGALLKISSRTVESYILKLKEKFKCKTKKELHEKLILSDLGRIISYIFMGSLLPPNEKLLYPVNFINASNNLIEQK